MPDTFPSDVSNPPFLPFVEPAPAAAVPAAKLILGIDPGITGGLAFLTGTQVWTYDIPNVAGEVDVDALAGIVRMHQPAFAVIERAGAMPKQGVSSTFKYGVAYGALRAVVAVLHIPHRLVSPVVWKRHFKLDRDKEKSRALAIQLWPGCG